MTDFSRRRFLSRTAGASAGLLLSQGGGGWAVAGDRVSQKRLVVVFLRGAVDGLSILAPYRDPAYRTARPTIALEPGGTDKGALDLDGHFGLHPALAALLPYWRDGQLAFVPASGSPDPSRSHFDAQDFMETGTPGRLVTADGWMNRLIGVLPGSAGPTRAMSVGPRRPRILAGPRASAAISLAGGNPGRGLATDRPAVGAAFDRLYDGGDGMSLLYRQGVAARQELMAGLAEPRVAAADDTDPMATHMDASANNGAAHPSGFPLIAGRLAQLLRNDDRIALAFADLGGWDTHVNQGNATGQLANHLKPLGDGLAILMRDLGSVARDTVVLVMSEFGRTVRENGGAGTDHGHGNVMWALGGGVGGGKIYGAWPGLDNAALYEGRDVAVTTDYRTVVAAFLERHLRLDDRQLASVFPQAGADAARLGGIALG